MTNMTAYKNSNLMVVTKNQSTDDIETLVSKEFNLFGENRVQEAKIKYESLKNRDILKLHMIGPLQTNKVKLALKIFDAIQTIDRYSLVDEIAKFTIKGNSRVKEFYIQINIGDESQKSGIPIKNFSDLYKYCLNKNLNIVGLMCIPPNTEDPSKYFKKMNSIRDETNENLKLSMGMSNDYKCALSLNSNIIRVGSLIFSWNIFFLLFFY